MAVREEERRRSTARPGVVAVAMAEDGGRGSASGNGEGVQDWEVA